MLSMHEGGKGDRLGNPETQMIMSAFDLVKLCCFFYTEGEKKKLCDGGGPRGHVSRDPPSTQPPCEGTETEIKPRATTCREGGDVSV